MTLSQLLRRIWLHRSDALVGRIVSRWYGDTIRSDDCIFDVSNPLISPSVKASLFWDLYERVELAYIAQYLPDDRDVIELGSSLGVTACHIKKKLQTGARLVCVEADPDLAGVVQQNLRLNGLADRVVVLNRAVYYEELDAEVTFMRGHSSTAGRVTSSRQDGSKISVPRVQLSDIAREYGLGEFSLVLDIEGAEAGIAFGERSELEGCRLMIVDLHETTYQGQPVHPRETCAAFIDNHGFRLTAERHPIYVFSRP